MGKGFRDEADYRKWLYYELLELVESYGINTVRNAVHKMEDKYESVNQK